MNPLKELRDLMPREGAVESGIVVAITASGIQIRTKSGLKSFATATGTYKPGDTVRYQGNLLLGKALGADSVPVFHV